MIPDKSYPHPKTAPQTRRLVCAGCDTVSDPIRGEWNTKSGKWFLGYTCKCGVYQGIYVSEPKNEQQPETKTMRLAFNDED